MNARVILTSGLILASTLLSGCQRGDVTTSGSAHGRYVGVGIYAPGTPWTQMVLAQPPTSSAAARLVDDQAIIVVTDSSTGEIRACGDMSGYCVGMNPWNSSLAQSQLLPVKLAAHAKPPESTSDSDNAADNAAAPPQLAVRLR
jgi:hypothetical protein